MKNLRIVQSKEHVIIIPTVTRFLRLPRSVIKRLCKTHFEIIVKFNEPYLDLERQFDFSQTFSVL